MRLSILLSAVAVVAASSSSCALADFSLKDQNSRPVCDSRYAASGAKNIVSCTAVLKASNLSNYERAMTLNVRGNNYDFTKQYDLAIADYTEVIRLLPDFDYAYANRALEKLRKNDCKSALVDYDKALSLNSDNAYARYGRGIARLRCGDMLGGQSDINTADNADSATAKTYREIGMTP